MSSVRRPRRVDRRLLYLLAGTALAASATGFSYWMFSISDAPFTGFMQFIILALALPLTGAALVLAGARLLGSDKATTPAQRLLDLAELLPTGRGLLDLDSGRRMWISMDEVGQGEGLRTVTSLICVDIDPDDGFTMATTVYTLTGTGAKRTTGTVAELPDDQAAAALATPIPKGAEPVGTDEIEELYAQLDRAVLADDRQPRRPR